MDVILIESVTGLGRPGDQVKVKTGYARNYLVPAGKALPVSKEVLRGLDKLKARAEEEERALVSSMEELKARLSGENFTLTARATEEGHLFGSIAERDIQDALEAAGWAIPPRAVRMELHLKEAGIAEVEVHLYGEITAMVNVEVVPIDADGNPIEVVEPGQQGAENEDGNADAGSEAAGAAPAGDVGTGPVERGPAETGADAASSAAEPPAGA